jgi:hypothetical protein
MAYNPDWDNQERVDAMVAVGYSRALFTTPHVCPGHELAPPHSWYILVRGGDVRCGICDQLLRDTIQPEVLTAVI